MQMHRTATGTPTCACGVGIMRTEAATVTSTDEWLPFDWIRWRCTIVSFQSSRPPRPSG